MQKAAFSQAAFPFHNSFVGRRLYVIYSDISF
jgi:hypothetical protein